MQKITIWTMLTLLLLPGVVAAEMSVSITGLLRQETSTFTGDANVYNQDYGNIFNGRTITNALGSQITRDRRSSEPDFPLFATRAELDFKFRFSDNWEGFLKIRGFYEWSLDDEFDDLDLFDSGFDNGRGSTFEINGEQYMLDIPAMYLDYNSGPLWLRMGTQQIAWGEAIFFRVFDVPNGLDLRRHSFLDVAAEEYSDKRVPALGIRGSYGFDNGWEVEAFAQHFRPSVLGPANSPYNFIASQFTIQQDDGWDRVDDKVNFGARLTGSLGDFDLNFMYTHRYNPDGVFRWTESRVNVFAGIPGFEPIGALLAQTAFEPNLNGVWTSSEWFRYAGLSRLDGVTALSASVAEFPAAQALGAFVINDANCQALGVPDPRACANVELDVFFDPVVGPLLGGGLGPLVGHLAREYFDEDIFGFGFTYVFQGEPNTFLEQLVLRAEATYTPDRVFTNPSLSRDYLEENEFVSNLSLEKYHRFSTEFPATYFVLQWLHKTESDMLGRHLSGFDNDGTPNGEDSFNAIVFALQQPFPGLIWRGDLAVLYDTNGGLLIQPGLKWRPRGNMQVDVYANIIQSDGDNDDVMQTFEDMDEIFARFTFYF